MKIEFSGTIEEYKKFLSKEIERLNKIDNQEYIDLGLPSGTLWAKYNIGASSEEEYGDYFNWNDASEKYQLPTNEQFEELHKECQWKWCSINNKNGYLVIGKNGNNIFLPAAGYRDGSSLDGGGSYGNYWSATPNSSYSNYAYGLYFGSSYISPASSDYRGNGFSLRTVKNKN